MLLFGLYPIVKYLDECRLPVFTQLSGKLAYFNIVLVLAAVLVSCGLFSAGADAGCFPARRTVDRGKYRLYCI